MAFPGLISGVLKDGERAVGWVADTTGKVHSVRESSYEVTPSKAERDRGRPTNR